LELRSVVGKASILSNVRQFSDGSGTSDATGLPCPAEAAMSDAIPLEPRGLRWMRAAGHLAARAGAGIASAYRAIDPDVQRHLAELPLLGLTMLAARRPAAEPLPDDGHRPIVFVHGLGGHRGNFLPTRLFLRLNGRSRTYSLGFPPGSDLEALAAELRRFIEEVCTVNGLAADAQIDLVAHSMGGLLARLALEDAATRARVATLVTMGTPHGGTHAARYAATPTLRSLRPESALMLRLDQQIPWQGPPRLVAFWSASDLLLLPARAACVEGAENIEIEGLTHYGYLLNPVSFRRLLLVLAG
jgi:pimeloyl-ACP methyl ester carboxylesterase